MGLRGVMPSNAALRIVKGQRTRRRAPRRLPATPRAVVEAQVKEMRRVASVFLLKAEKKPTVQTRNNGEQFSPVLRAALELFEQADRAEGRYMRRTDGIPAGRRALKEPKDELDAFRNRKTKG